MERSPKVIGYWMSDKKSQKLNWAEFAPVARAQGFDLVKLNLNKSLEDQGPFTVIIHKLTEIIARATKNDEKAKSMLKHVESYITAHPDVVIIDPFQNVRKLLDRCRSYRVIEESKLNQIGVFTPTFVELMSADYKKNVEALKRAGVEYPFVCKPSVAHGTEGHKMAIVFNEEGVKDCQPPCVAHTFLNHNAVLFKVFIVGDEYHVVERPSLKNFYPSDQKTIFFDSHSVSKSDSSSSLSVLDEDVPKPQVNPTKLQEIVTTLREELGMSLLGVDVVVENTTGHHAVIDINPYPGYDGYPNFFDSLMRCIQHNVQAHGSQVSCTLFPQDQDDSGFETADSSDEKKRNNRSSSTIVGGKNKERQL